MDALPRWAVSCWRYRHGLTKGLSASKLGVLARARTSAARVINPVSPSTWRPGRERSLLVRCRGKTCSVIWFYPDSDNYVNQNNWSPSPDLNRDFRPHMDGVLVIRRSGDGSAGWDRTTVLPVMSRALGPTQLQHHRIGSAYGFRTRFSALKGRRPSPRSPMRH